MGEESIFKADRESLLCWGALFCLLALSGIKDGILLLQYDTPVGIDGYYYVVQVRSFLENGAFHYPTNTPFVLYLMSIAAKLSGDVVIGVKATSIFLHTVLSFSLFALVASLTKSMWTGLLASAVSVLSTTHLIWMGEFLNQLGGLAFFFLGAACLSQNPKSNFWRVAALVFFIISVFCHKSIVFLVAVWLSLALLFHTLKKIRSSRLSVLKICAVILFCLCLPAVAARQAASMPQQISETVLSTPRIPIKRTAFEEKLSLLFLAPLGLALCLKESPAKPLRWPHYVIGSAALFTILFTLNPFLSHEEDLMTISQRLDLLSYLQISVLLSGIVWLLSNRRAALIISLSVISLLLLGNSALPIGFQRSFVARREALVNDLIRVRSKISANSVIIAPHGEQFLVTYATRMLSQKSAITNDGQEKNIAWLLFEAPCRASQNATLVSRSTSCALLVSENYPLPVTDAEKSQIILMNPHLKNAPGEVIDKVLTMKN
jgi:hypothetical protein